jgi:hypothetical protein
MPTYRDAILNGVNSHQGIKGVELVIHTMGLINPLKFDDEEYHQTVEQLIKEEEIIELEYILPQLEYRVKSLYFPKGTKFSGKLTDWSN